MKNLKKQNGYIRTDKPKTISNILAPLYIIYYRYYVYNILTRRRATFNENTSLSQLLQNAYNYNRVIGSYFTRQAASRRRRDNNANNMVFFSV